MATDLNRCPICGSGHSTEVGPSLFYCRRCRIAYNATFEKDEYAEKYFLDDYRKQYGRTYREDFNAIYSISQKRMGTILQCLPKQCALHSLSLLDIGSALGFFLKCARDFGIMNVTGIEVSKFASRACKSEFGIDVINAPFPGGAPDAQYDVITAWYFIEHTEDPAAIIKKIHSMLNENGIFALTAPSIKGPLFQLHREQWISSHPKDHRTDFSPRGMKKLLKKIGFRSVKVKPGGFHPERVVPEGSLFHKPFALVYKLFSRILVHSDTIEAYAVK